MTLLIVWNHICIDLLLLRNSSTTFTNFIINVNPFSFLTKNDDGLAPSFPQDEDTEMPLLDDDWVSRIVISLSIFKYISGHKQHMILTNTKFHFLLLHD